jgi:hypothetical protein
VSEVAEALKKTVARESLKPLLYYKNENSIDTSMTPDTQTAVRYYRVTYSHKPRSEFAVVAGLRSEGAQLSASESRIFSSLVKDLESASRCAPKQ